jgi:dihydropteroate synthase
MSAGTVRLRAADRTFELGGRPWLMGIVNASPESFSGGSRPRTLEGQIELAAELLAAGADAIDVGGESARTDLPAISLDEELERVVPLVEGVAGDLGALVSVDTHKAAVAREAVAAGARIVNDVSGLRDPELAAVCAQTGAALVVMHTLSPPGRRMQQPTLYVDVTAEVIDFLGERMAAAIAAGMDREQLIVDPGPDFAKTPAQTIRLLSELPRLAQLGRPILLAISRKDFIGALTGRPPHGRLAGTLAALAHGVDAGGHIIRVHDVAAAADFLAVRDALSGALVPGEDLALADELRYDPPDP